MFTSNNDDHQAHELIPNSFDTEMEREPSSDVGSKSIEIINVETMDCDEEQQKNIPQNSLNLGLNCQNTKIRTRSNANTSSNPLETSNFKYTAVIVLQNVEIEDRSVDTQKMPEYESNQDCLECDKAQIILNDLQNENAVSKCTKTKEIMMKDLNETDLLDEMLDIIKLEFPKEELAEENHKIDNAFDISKILEEIKEKLEGLSLEVSQKTRFREKQELPSDKLEVEPPRPKTTCEKVWTYGLQFCTIQEIRALKKMPERRDNFTIFIKEENYSDFMENVHADDDPLYAHMLILNVLFCGKITGVRSSRLKNDDKYWIEVSDIRTGDTVLGAYRKCPERVYTGINKLYSMNHQQFNDCYKTYIQRGYLFPGTNRLKIKWTEKATDNEKSKFANLGTAWLFNREAKEVMRTNNELQFTYTNGSEFIGRIVQCTGLLLQTKYRYVYLRRCEFIDKKQIDAFTKYLEVFKQEIETMKNPQKTIEKNQNIKKEENRYLDKLDDDYFAYKRKNQIYYQDMPKEPPEPKILFKPPSKASEDNISEVIAVSNICNDEEVFHDSFDESID